MRIHLNSDVKVTWISYRAISFLGQPFAGADTWYNDQRCRFSSYWEKNIECGRSCKWCQQQIAKAFIISACTSGAILDKNDVWGTPSSLSLTTNKLRLLLLYVNANVYVCQREEASRVFEVNQAFPLLRWNRIHILNGLQLWIYEFFLPHFQHQIPHHHFREKKKAACTYFSYSLLILTHDVLRCGIMKLVEQKGKKKKEKKTATKS